MDARQTTSKAAQGLLPQLEAAIAYLNDEIQQIRSGQKDQSLHDLIADPLPREQFRGLLQVWKLPPVPVELSKLFLQLEELKEKERKEKERVAEEQRKKEELEAAAKVQASSSEPPVEVEEPEEIKVVNSDAESAIDDEAEDAAQEETETPAPTETKQEQGEEVSEDTSSANTNDIPTPKVESTNDGGAQEKEVPQDAADTAGSDRKLDEPASVVVVPKAAVETPVPSRPRIDEPAIELKKEPTSASPTPPRPLTPTPTPVPSAIASLPTAVAAPVAVPARVPSPQTATPQPPVAATPSKADAAREIALVNLRALRRSMMLDVLSKIVSVAKSKGVDPAMFSSRAKVAPETVKTESFVDLEMIQQEVSKGAICEWEHFAKQVYLFCQHVIAESEKQDRQDAKQKGIELLHFAKTLTETLRKASLKKEENIMKTTPTTTPTSTSIVSSTTAAKPVPPTSSVSAPVVQNITIPSRPSVITTERNSSSLTPPTNNAIGASQVSVSASEGSPMAGAPTDSASTPHRASARIRQRENSVDSPSPQRRRPNRSGDDDQADAGTDSRTRKRPRVGATDELSASESQMSTSETAPTASSGDPEPKPRTRKRRPIMPATRASSRQQKRRAAKAAAEAAKDDDDEGQDTKEEYSEEQDDAATEENDEDADSEDVIKPIQLTKSGRPRKKPGRKPKK